MGWDPSIVAEDGEHEVIYFNPCDVGVKREVDGGPAPRAAKHRGQSSVFCSQTVTE